jgi:heme/copper-type cytochrome/quinol oxidase subunit 2
MWIVIGVVLAVLVVIVVAVYTFRKNRREEKVWEE